MGITELRISPGSTRKDPTMGANKKTARREKLEVWVEQRVDAIWTNLHTNRLWQRMFKYTLATSITVIIAIIPAVVSVYGKATYLAAMTTVFGHPGRRFGQMFEALLLAASGSLVGVGWSLFGIYLSSLVYATNPPAAYTIKALFFLVALLVHGYLRSHTPRLFLFVLLEIIVSAVGLTGTSVAATKAMATQLIYPIFTAIGVLILVNVLVFPEFSSSFLGITTIETLGETVGVLRDTGRYFIAMVEDAPTSQDQEKVNELSKVGTRPATSAEKPAPKPLDLEASFSRRMLRIFWKPKEDDGENFNEIPKAVNLKALTDSKANLRAKLASCKAAQEECNFEIAYAMLPPRDLKTISVTLMKQLVGNTISLIGACESKYALMGDGDDGKEDETKNEHQMNDIAGQAHVDSDNETSRPSSVADDSNDDSDYRKYLKEHSKKRKRRKKSKSALEENKEDLELVKPRKEIEFGDPELVKILIRRIAKPLADLQETVDRSVDVVTSSLAYCYEVPLLPSGSRAPDGIELEEIDIRMDILTDALSAFDRNSAHALEGSDALRDPHHHQPDIMPRMETFLISSFLLNLRQAALHTLEMLRHSRVIVEKRQARHGRRRFYAPRIHWRKWLSSGGEVDMLALPESGRQAVRSGKKDESEDSETSSTTSKKPLMKKGKDVESGPTECHHLPSTPEISKSKVPVKASNGKTLIFRLRNGLADIIEFIAGSEDVAYAVKIAVAMFLVTWPAFIHKWNAWYSADRGLWAALQLVLITEVSLGTSISVFTLRAFGTTLGCIWGYAAYEASGGSRVICVVLLTLGIIPSTYVALGSKYVKAGMVSAISMCIVALATFNLIPAAPTDTFVKRLIAFLIGGVVALAVEVVLFPVKARDRLVESLASSINQISEMEACLAYGIESETNVDVHSKAVSNRFDRAKSKAEGALAAAETFLPFCANEPRLKGSFEGMALIYSEILYVLHAIVDRMDNMLHLRQEYGSGVLEELNAQVYPYRRNVAGSITLVLFAVHEALTTKVPLPQFLPSARLAHLRMVNRVREVVLSRTPQLTPGEIGRSEIEMTMIRHIVRQKFLSWNAASAGQIEVIEYLEELIDLVKLLVGANEFRSGLLTRPTHREYVVRPADALFGEASSQIEDEQDELRDTVPGPVKVGLVKRKTMMYGKEKADAEKGKARG